MSHNERIFIKACIGEMVAVMRKENPRLAPGEIYDAIAAELERRCRAITDLQSQANSSVTGLMSPGENEP